MTNGSSDDIAVFNRRRKMAECLSQMMRKGRRRSVEEQPFDFSTDSSGFLSEDQFLCSICLDVFTDPVSTPCGHNFCMKCIGTCWCDCEQCQCPFCKETFTKRPELKINTTLREVVDHFRKKCGPEKPELLCDACTGVKQKALKSCLDCGVTFCKSHLEPHNTVPKLKKHKLINPVKNLENYICQKHERPLELFCRDDEMYVCVFCTEGDHKHHDTVPIEEESGEIKIHLEKTQTEVQQMIQDRLKKIKDIKHSVELRKRNTEKEKADSVKVFTALIHSIEKSQAELLEVMEEKQKAAERQAEDLIKELEQEITELQRRNTELEQISHTEDHLHLLKVYPSLCRPPHTNNWTDTSIDPHLNVETVRNALSQLQKSLNKRLTKTVNEKIRASGETLLYSTFTDKKSLELKRIQQYPVSPDSSGFLSKDQFLCSIGLEVLTDPVSTPCGHNFCKTCLTQYWDSTEHCHCPFCKEIFTRRPELKINTTLREVVDHFKKKSGPEKPELLCDVCTGVKQKALKSCLDCGVTFCKSHLEPHNTVPKLKKHKLINPVKNLENYICQKHERPLELFCRDDEMYVCVFCTEGDHKHHDTVPIEEESGEIKIHLEKTQTEVQQMIQDRLKKIKDIKHLVELRKLEKTKTEVQQMIQDRLKKIKDIKHSVERNTEKEKADSVKVFTALIYSIERCQAELLKVMEEKQKAAERQAEDLIKDLEQEITELQRRNTELQQISHTEDHLHLLQVNLARIQQQYAVDVTLDADTAHPKLILSDDGKQMMYGDTKQNLLDTPMRFTYHTIILGKEGFSSRRFYYEVQVSGKTRWDLGVVRESINRKGEVILSPQIGFWTVGLRNENEYKACAGPAVLLSLREKLQKVGVFVDYEEGLVSFYDVESRSHIYSSTGQSFTEKLYPYFNPCTNDRGKNSAPLVISPVSKTE
ncbi:hypothetical protein NFI96_016725 [Prochilodus magdalenae]|nr:hypothetical protein NFI96_016725 [Prochilodus magdalenae]